MTLYVKRSHIHRLNSLLNIPPARLLANPPEYIALEAKFDAWLNLSHLEKATVFVIVRTSAIAKWRERKSQHVVQYVQSNSGSSQCGDIVKRSPLFVLVVPY